MDLSGYATVLPIVIICYLIGTGCKLCPKISDKMIPVIVGVAGRNCCDSGNVSDAGFPGGGRDHSSFCWNHVRVRVHRNQSDI